MRMTILAMPPVIPLVHSEMGMSETQVGLLIGSAGAVRRRRRSGITAHRAARRAYRRCAGHDYRGACRRLTQRRHRRADALRRGHRDRLRRRHHAAGNADAGRRMAAGPHCARHHRLYQRYADGRAVGDRPDHSRRLAAGRRLLAARSPGVGGACASDRAGFFIFSPKEDDHSTIDNKIGALWWPNFKDPLVWLLGLTFGSNNSPFFGTNAFLGDYLASQGKAGLLGAALGWLNGAQLVAPIILLVAGQSPAGPLLAVLAVRSGCSWWRSSV